VHSEVKRNQIYVNLTITDLNRSAWMMHFGYCFAYDNCFWQLTVVYICLTMEKLDTDFVSSVATFFAEGLFFYRPQLRKFVSEHLFFWFW
jgi:hypothetical protein